MYMFMVRHSAMTGTKGMDLGDYFSFASLLAVTFTTYWFFRYTRLASSGLSYTVETSVDLANWTSDATAAQSVISTTDGVETVEVTVTGAPLTDAAFFVRIDAQ